MARKPGQDFRSAQSGLSELKSRLFFVIGALLVFRAWLLCADSWY